LGRALSAPSDTLPALGDHRFAESEVAVQTGGKSPRNHARLRRQLFVVPFFLWFVFFIIGPIYVLFTTSVSHRSPYGVVERAFDAIAYPTLAEGVYLKVLLTTLAFAVGNTVFTVLLAFPVAFLLTRVGLKTKMWLLTLVLIPFATSFLVRILAFMDLIRGEHLGMELLYQPAGVLMALVYNYLPFAILPLYSALEKIDPRLFDAAKDLGASPFRVFTRVLLPLARGGLLSASLFVFVPSLGEYLIPELVGGGRHFLLGSFLQNQFFSARNWPLGSAVIVLLVLFTFMSVRFLPEEETA